MSLDFKSLAIVMFISNVLQVAALFTQLKMANKYQGIGWWTAGIAAIALGFLAMFMRSIPGLTLAGVFANNMLFVIGHVFLYVGILRFFDRRESRRALMHGMIVYTLADIYLVFIYNNLVWRGSLLYLAICLLSFLSAWTLWKYKPRLFSASVHFVASAFVLHGFMFFIGLILGFVVPPSTNSPTDTNVGQLLGIMDGIIVSMLWTFGFILMVNQRLNAETREARQEMELIFNASPDAVMVSRLKDGLVADINEGFTSVTGFTRADAVGYSTLDLKLWQDPANRQVVVEALLEKGMCANLEFNFLRKDGSQITGIYSARLISLRGEAHILSVIHDVTERKLLEMKLQDQATTDVLTGVANRRRFIDLAEVEVKRALRLAQPLAIVLIDIDFFKQINDTYGHQAGDQVLLHFAQLCRQKIREIDLLARIGGDEFAIVMPHTNCAQALEAIERVRPALSDNEDAIQVHFTAGIACLPCGVSSLDGLLGRADQALYRAKNAGRNRTEVDRQEF